MKDNQTYMVLISRRDNTPVEYVTEGYRAAMKVFLLAEEYSKIDKDILRIEIFDETGACIECEKTFQDAYEGMF